MFTKIALTAAIIAGTASVALATEFDPNLGNRYPAYSMTTQLVAPTFTSRDVALSGGQAYTGSQQIWFDRAGRSHDNGGGR